MTLAIQGAIFPPAASINSGVIFRSRKASSKAYVELGWEPQVDLEDGVRSTFEWYKREVLPALGAAKQ